VYPQCSAQPAATAPRPPGTPSWPFLSVCVGAAAVFAGWCLFLAGREWFVGDDFAFLAQARQPWNWAQVFLPLGPRFWWSYRPLSTDVFFSLGFKAFGLNPFGYLVVSLSLHFLTGLLVWRLARQLGFEARVAIVTALLSVSRFPFLAEGLWISVSQYTITMFCYTACLSLFLDYARTTRVRFQAAACVALVLALLSNEVGATLAGVIVLLSWYVDGFSLARGDVRRTLRRTIPLLIVTAAYVVVRTTVIGAAQLPPVYRWMPGWHMPGRYAWTVFFVLGNGQPPLWVWVTLVLGALLGVVWQRRGRGAALRWLVGVNVVGLGWIAIALVPYAGLPFPYPRYAMAIEVPTCLLLGAYLSAFARAYAPAQRAAVEALLVLVLAVSVPYGSVLPRKASPRGTPAKHFLRVIGDRSASVSHGTTVVVQYGARGLGSPAEAEEFRVRIFGGAALGAVYPDKGLRLVMLDLRKPPPGDLRCPPCLFLDLQPGMLAAPAVQEPMLLAFPR
jgi:hypothetical protein